MGFTYDVTSVQYFRLANAIDLCGFVCYPRRHNSREHNLMKRISLLVLALSLVLSACGGPSTALHVIMTDFQFTPNTFTVPVSQPITLELVNNGAATHSFIIMKAGAKIEGHFTDADKANVYWEQTDVAPGQSLKVTFTAPSEPGDYQVVCGVPAHFESGMVATLTVAQP